MSNEHGHTPEQLKELDAAFLAYENAKDIFESTLPWTEKGSLEGEMACEAYFTKLYHEGYRFAGPMMARMGVIIRRKKALLKDSH
jgi:hypothetical protein